MNIDFFNIKKLALQKWQNIAKPLGGLGVLEEDIARICAALGSLTPIIDKKALVVFCADNGVVEENISQTDVNTTLQVVKNMSIGKSCVQIMAKKAGVHVIVADIGVIGIEKDLYLPPYNEKTGSGILNMAVRRGTGNIVKENAMTKDECLTIIQKASDLAQSLRKSGYNLLSAGEMGIGNTTTTSVLASLLLSQDASKVTGKGAGLNHKQLLHKIEIVRLACKRVQQDTNIDKNDIIDLLAQVGGFDIAALVGFYLGAAKSSTPIVLDGVISLVAALCAIRLDSNVSHFMILSHEGSEKACHLLIAALQYYDKGLLPAIKAGFHVGEGTGAVAFMPLLDMVLAVYSNMISFSDCNIKAYKPNDYK